MNTLCKPQARIGTSVLVTIMTLTSFIWFPSSAQAWLFPFLFRAAVRSAVINGFKDEIKSSRQRCKSNPKTCRPASKRFAQWKSRNKSRLKAARSKKSKIKHYHRTRR
jgi:hypothetical protein